MPGASYLIQYLACRLHLTPRGAYVCRCCKQVPALSTVQMPNHFLTLSWALLKGLILLSPLIWLDLDEALVT